VCVLLLLLLLICVSRTPPLNLGQVHSIFLSFFLFLFLLLFYLFIFSFLFFIFSLASPRPYITTSCIILFQHKFKSPRHPSRTSFFSFSFILFYFNTKVTSTQGHPSQGHPSQNIIFSSSFFYFLIPSQHRPQNIIFIDKKKSNNFILFSRHI